MVLQFLNQNYLNYSFFLNDIIIYLEFLEISFLLFKKTQVFNLNNFFKNLLNYFKDFNPLLKLFKILRQLILSEMTNIQVLSKLKKLLRQLLLPIIIHLRAI